MASTESSQDDRYLYMLDYPAYPTAEAARLADLSSGQVKRWLRGYEFAYRAKSEPHVRHSQKPPVIPRKPDPLRTYASFLDVIDLLLVSQFLEHGLSLQQVRLEFAEAKRILQVDHLAYETFFTIGRKVFLEIDAGYIVALSTGGQLAIDNVIRQLGEQIEFDEETKLAIRWYPLHPDRRVVVDPFISFGRPVISGRRITTSNIHEFFVSEEGNVDVICDWMGVKEADVRSALKLEEQLAA